MIVKLKETIKHAIAETEPHLHVQKMWAQCIK